MLNVPLALPNGTILSNRFAKSATSECLADRTGAPSAGLAALYRRFAEGGASLLITGNVMVDAVHLENPRAVVARADASDAFRSWADGAHEGGAAIVMQISHAGRQTPRMLTAVPVAPSAIEAVHVLKSFGAPRALAPSEIEEIRDAFVRAAVLAHETGFDGVQLHAAHGYLLSTFMSPKTNLRTDQWGGPRENRARLLLDVMTSIRARLPRSFLLSVKLNSTDFDYDGGLEDVSWLVRELDVRGLDLLEVSGGTYENPVLFSGESSAVRESTRRREAYFLDFAASIPRGSFRLMVTGGFRTPEFMNEALTSEATDVIGLARPLIVNPDFPRDVLRGKKAPAESFAGLATRSKGLGSLAVNAWHVAQLHRMARNENPNPRISTAWAIATYLILSALCAAAIRMGARRVLSAPLLTERTDAIG